MTRNPSRVAVVLACLVACVSLAPGVASARPLFPNPILDIGTRDGLPLDPGDVAFGDFNGDGKADLAVAIYSGDWVEVFLGRGDGTFGSRADYPVGAGSISVQVADMNGDGLQDLIALSSPCCGPGAGISVLFGLGDGTFAPEIRILADQHPDSVVPGDFNRDGHADLAVGIGCTDTGDTFCQQSDVVVLEGDGTGAFSPAARFTVPGIAFDLATADFDGDGRLDLAVQNGRENSSTVLEMSILLGNGDGTFGAPTQYGDIGRGRGQILAADFDADGRPDVALIACCNSRNVSFLLNTGNGSFSESFPRVGYNAVGLAAGDADGDGHLDLAVANFDSDDVSILRGDGRGGFAPAVQVPAGNGPGSLALADVDRDGRLDLTVGNELSGTVLTRFGNGDGTFGTPARAIAGTYPQDLVFGDFDHDGHADLAVTQAWTFFDPITGGVSLLPGLGDGTFGAQTTLAADPGRGPALAADLNGDGVTDLAVGNLPDGGLSVFLSRGDGTFDPERTYPTGAGPATILDGDLDGDGLRDLVVVNEGLYYPTTPGGVSILLGIGGGLFGATGDVPAGPAPASGVIGEFNGDGRTDLAVVNRDTSGTGNGQVLILLGDGRGGFAPGTVLTAGIASWQIAAADFDADGHEDLAVANLGPFVCSDPCKGDVSLFLGAGDGSFAPGARVTTGGAPVRIVVADVNRDGRPDLVTANASEDIGVLLGNGDGTFAPPLRFGMAGYPYAFGVADLDGDGLPDLSVTSDDALTVLLQQAAPDPVSIGNITVSFDNPIGRGSGTVSWRTEYESGIVGFNVVLYDFNGNRIQLNDAPIPCTQCVTGLGASYSFIVPKHKSGRNLFVEAVLPDGRTSLSGPAVRQQGPPRITGQRVRIGHGTPRRSG